MIRMATGSVLKMPANLPSIANATLPVVYQKAKEALATCDRIDECKDWADKTAALASYAKQSEDEALFKMAMRIRGRALRRCGELLREFQNQGARTDKQLRGGTDPKSQGNGDATGPVSIYARNDLH